MVTECNIYKNVMNEKIIPSGKWNDAAVLSSTVIEKDNNKKHFPLHLL